jgi:hypothetical protein
MGKSAVPFGGFLERESIHAMKKYMIFIVLCLLCLLTSCGGNNLITPLSPNTNDRLSTIVAATLTAFSSESHTAETTPTQLPIAALFTPTLAPKLSLDDFQNKEFVGENDIYSIYLINRTGGTDAAPTGELLVFNKSTDQIIKMSGLFTVIIGGGTIVFDDRTGKYVLLSIGTYTSRDAVVLSLEDQKQAVNDFCMSSGQNGDHLFWSDYIIINNCDTFPNRPWGAGEAPSVTAINLKTGTETVIAKSDLTHQYSVKQIEGNTLWYVETYIENEADWQNQNKQITNDQTYDLTLLGNN